MPHPTEGANRVGLIGTLLLSSFSLSAAQSETLTSHSIERLAEPAIVTIDRTPLANIDSLSGLSLGDLPDASFLSGTQASSSETQQPEIFTRSIREFHWTPSPAELLELEKLNLPEGTPEEKASSLLSLFQELNKFAAFSTLEKEALKNGDPARYMRYENLSQILGFDDFGLTDDSGGEYKARAFLWFSRSLGLQGRLLMLDGNWVAGLQGNFQGDAVSHLGETYYLADPSLSAELLPDDMQGVGHYPYTGPRQLDVCLNALPFDQYLTVREPYGGTKTIEIRGDDVSSDFDYTQQYSTHADSKRALRVLKRLEREDISEAEALYRLKDEITYNLNQLIATHPEPVVQVVEAVTAGLRDPEEQAAALLKWVQSEITWCDDKDHFGERLSVFNQSPLQTISNGYGECLDMSTLLASMYRIAGIDCCVVWFNLPGEDDHATVAVSGRFKGMGRMSGDKFYYFAETTDPNARIGDFTTDFNDSYSFVVPVDF